MACTACDTSEKVGQVMQEWHGMASYGMAARAPSWLRAMFGLCLDPRVGEASSVKHWKLAAPPDPRRQAGGLPEALTAAMPAACPG